MWIEVNLEDLPLIAPGLTGRPLVTGEMLRIWLPIGKVIIVSESIS